MCRERSQVRRDARARIAAGAADRRSRDAVAPASSTGRRVSSVMPPIATIGTRAEPPRRAHESRPTGA
jgi:hypothetical protein